MKVVCHFCWGKDQAEIQDYPASTAIQSPFGEMSVQPHLPLLTDLGSVLPGSHDSTYFGNQGKVHVLVS